MASVQPRVQPTEPTRGPRVPFGSLGPSAHPVAPPLVTRIPPAPTPPVPTPPVIAPRTEPGGARGPQPVGPTGRRDPVRPGARAGRREPAVAGRALRARRSAVGAPGDDDRWTDGSAEAYVPLRLTRRGRRVGGALLVVIGLAIVALAAAITLGGDDDEGGLRLAGSTTVVVEPGDTLWSIAGEVAPDAERRAVVDAIADLNHLPAGQVRAGQVLRLP